MMRAMICCLALFALAPSVRAGELDREAAAAKPALVTPANATAKAPAGSEMDKESPQDAYYYRGHWGGFYPARFYYPGFYGFRSYALSPWAYRSYFWNWYYPTFYPVGWYGAYWF